MSRDILMRQAMQYRDRMKAKGKKGRIKSRKEVKENMCVNEDRKE